VAAAIGLDPVIDNTGSYPQATRDEGDGFPLGNFKDGQGAAIDTGIVGVAQLAFQTPLLPGGQGQGIHDKPPLQGRLPKTGPV